MRVSKYNINHLILKRWSPRALSGEMITDEDFLALLEAARFAPSSFNDQPWRFIYGKKGTEAWEKLFSLLIDFNKSWAERASHLVLIISRKNFSYNNNFNINHSFDAGAAWENLALEATSRNLVSHAIAGFDFEKAKVILNIPNDYSVEAMVVIGRPGKKEDLPAILQEREVLTERKDLEELIMEGEFKN
ncbi:MAG: nitroreductase family protein [Planctomycetes bacterium]|jgi:nitroreductase|nr:nitroreductase family protein [Planctomycetota bacterium]